MIWQPLLYLENVSHFLGIGAMKLVLFLINKVVRSCATTINVTLNNVTLGYFIRLVLQFLYTYFFYPRMH